MGSAIPPAERRALDQAAADNPVRCYACNGSGKARDNYSPLWDTDPQALAAIPPDEVPIAPVCSCGHPSAMCGVTVCSYKIALLHPAPKAPDVWMQALQGVAVDLVNPTPDQIDFRTIATVLARIPRFGGHTRNGPYSVAQHCIEGAHAILRDTGDALAAAAFLIHDAHEAYMGDITTPVQKALAAHAARQWPVPGASRAAARAVSDAFRALKWALDGAIYPAAGLPWPLPPAIATVVKSYDARMMVTERDARLDPPPYPWTRDAERVQGVDVLSMREGTVAALYWAACCEMLPALQDIPRAKVPLSRNICGNDD
jgi:hypothetical protein